MGLRITALLATSCVLLTLAESALAQWSQPSAREVIVRGGWLFDGVTKTRRPNTGLVIAAGKFVTIDAAPQDPVPAGTHLIVLNDKDTILPGMFDLHAHYNLNLVDAGRAEEVIHNGAIFLANGVTSTWSAGEYFPERVIDQRARIDAGESAGPRLFASGPYFGGFRCEYRIKTAADECAAWPNDITEQEIRDEIDHWAAQGVISIKIKQATPHEAKILIDQAHRKGMTSAGHLGNYLGEWDLSTRDAIEMGIDRIEHQLTLGSGASSAEVQEMVGLMLKHQVYYDANLQMYGGINLRNELDGAMSWTDEGRFFTPYARALLEKRGPPPPESDAAEFAQRELELRSLYEAGGANLLVIGTDEPVYTTLLPGFAFHRELLAIVHAGLPAVDVLQAATINGARALGVADRLGSIEVGKLADLYVAEGDPLEDIKSARNVKLVMKAGHVYEPAKLLRSAEGGIGPSGPDDHADWELSIRPLRTH